jgi:hypothetical protein
MRLVLIILIYDLTSRSMAGRPPGGLNEICSVLTGSEAF